MRHILSRADPILKSAAFQRLAQITFLGVLSPYFRDLDRHPIRYNEAVYDLSRRSHSLRVASLSAKISSTVALSDEAILYAYVWGLLHDVATWPLSHTGEAGFSETTGVSAAALRLMMITGDNAISPQLSLYGQLKEMSIDFDTLLALFAKTPSGLDREMALLHGVLHSPLTPDTLEGMHRSGRTFGVFVPSPTSFVNVLEGDLFSGVRLRASSSAMAFKFWRAKSKIYDEFINKPSAVEFESAWSRAIQDAFRGATLKETLELSEHDVLTSAMSVKKRYAKELLRYKDPLRYRLSENYFKKLGVDFPVAIDKLPAVFTKTRAER